MKALNFHREGLVKGFHSNSQERIEKWLDVAIQNEKVELTCILSNFLQVNLSIAFKRAPKTGKKRSALLCIWIRILKLNIPPHLSSIPYFEHFLADHAHLRTFELQGALKHYINLKLYAGLLPSIEILLATDALIVVF